ncbi:MAG: ROK family protein [Candidatus Omnitrophica bacterium]|nr:ROK family protein [Candidatus Omnitrophota bacterium]
MKYALGVDIGGTKTSLTLGNSHGKVLAKKILPTLTGRRTLEGIKQMSEGLLCLQSDCPAGRTIQGVGVGVPGPMNPKTGRVERSPHLAGWEGFPLKSFLERKLKRPVWITNDANAAAVGEKAFGAGRGVKNFVYLTISTGIGGGMVLGGKLLIGSSFGAGEVGHTIVVPGGARCGCGHLGCLEAYASGTAIAGFVRSEIRRGKKSKVSRWVGSGRRITA